MANYDGLFSVSLKKKARPLIGADGPLSEPKACSGGLQQGRHAGRLPDAVVAVDHQRLHGGQVEQLFSMDALNRPTGDLPSPVVALPATAEPMPLR